MQPFNVSNDLKQHYICVAKSVVKNQEETQGVCVGVQRARGVLVASLKLISSLWLRSPSFLSTPIEAVFIQLTPTRAAPPLLLDALLSFSPPPLVL